MAASRSFANQDGFCRKSFANVYGCQETESRTDNEREIGERICRELKVR